MLDRILPTDIFRIITERLNFVKVFELRFRSNCPVTVNYGGKYYQLNPGGIVSDGGTIICDRRLIEHIILKATDHSVYTVSNQLKNAFITVAGGIRIGICGEPVYDGGEIRTFKNYQSLNIRIPHEVPNCSLNAYDSIYGGAVSNTVVISPPGAGKTTFLRDIAKQLSDRANKNVLIIDERGEIAASAGGAAQLDVGKNTDVLTNCGKRFGFEQGIRAMRPDVIITDELGGRDDAEALLYAVTCGVSVIASCHAKDQFDLYKKPDFEALCRMKVINRFIVLSSRKGPGTYEGIYDENFTTVYRAQ